MKQIKTEELLKILAGNHILKTVIEILNENGIKADKQKAIYLIHRLKKRGYVKTKQTQDNIRVYYISKKVIRPSYSFIDILNENSPQKLYNFDDYIIHNKKPSLEEVLIYAIKSKNIRKIISCIGLFKKIKNWSLLYRLAKKQGLQRQVGALYDVARTVIKTRKVTKRFRNLSLPKKSEKFQFIIDRYNSKHFQEIEKKWKVYIPLNYNDLEDYRMFKKY